MEKYKRILSQNEETDCRVTMMNKISLNKQSNRKELESVTLVQSRF